MIGSGICSAQMYGVYNDFAGLDGIIYGNAEGYAPSNPPFCYHSNFTLTVSLYSPLGRSSFGGSETALSFDDEEGEWYSDATFSFECTCVGPVSTYSGVADIISIHVGRYAVPSPITGPICKYWYRICTEGTDVCGTIPHQVLQSGYCPEDVMTKFAKRPNKPCFYVGFTFAAGPGPCY